MTIRAIYLFGKLQLLQDKSLEKVYVKYNLRSIGTVVCQVKRTIDSTNRKYFNASYKIKYPDNPTPVYASSTTLRSILILDERYNEIRN